MLRKCVLITGASKGIGAATAILFASKGYDVIINYNSDYDGAIKVKKSAEKYNVQTQVIKADISNEIEVKNMINEIINNFGKLDVLINNAAISIDDFLENKKVDDFKRVIDVNLNGTFIVSKYASQYMSSGSIINVSSNNALDCYNSYSMDYDASKAGIILLTKNLAVSLPNIRVNCVCPGWVNTESVKKMNPDIIEEEKNKIIMNRFADPKEIASVIYFLTTEEASYINGSIIRVDGGIK